MFADEIVPYNINFSRTGCHDTTHEDIRHYDTKHEDIRHYDTHHKDIWHYDTQHKDIRNYDTQHDGIQHNKQKMRHSVWQYTWKRHSMLQQCLLSRGVSQLGPLWSVPFCRMSWRHCTASSWREENFQFSLKFENNIFAAALSPLSFPLKFHTLYFEGFPL